MEAKYYTKQGDGAIICNLCPHNCHIKIDKLGICSTRKNQNGVLEVINSGIIASSGLDPIEKKPLYHFHPGSKIYSIGGYGCNLKCVFCQNFEISQCVPEQGINLRTYEPAEIAARASILPENIGIAYTYNEPTVFFEFMLGTAEVAKKNKLLNVMVSNGYINPKPLQDLLNVIDAFSIDLKAFSESFYRGLAGGKLQPVLETLYSIRKASKHLEIAFLVIPGKNDDADEAKSMFLWIAENLGDNTVLHINKYYPAYRLQTPPTSTEKLIDLYNTAKEQLKYVYIGNLHAEGTGSNTTCPACKSTVIKRSGYHTKITALDSQGYCQICGFGPIVKV